MNQIAATRGASNHRHLFQPGRLGTLTLPNRIMMAPMESNMAAPDGAVSPEILEYYRRRAAGGAGMLIIEYTCIDGPVGLGGAPQLRLDSDAMIDSHRRLVEAIHAEGGKACVQLFHAGRQTHPKYTGGLQPLAASPIPCPLFRQMPRELHPDELAEIAEKFGQGAERAMAAGYDAVEIHGAHGYLPGNFLSGAANVRHDEFGGSLANRQRFPLMITQSVRQGAGQAPVIFRLSADEFVTGGTKIEEAVDTSRRLAAAGVDAIHVSTGTHERMDANVDLVSAPQGWRLPLARQVRDAVDVPVIGVGVIRDPSVADTAIADGSVDFVALGRALLADPDWPAKAARGDDAEIRPCTSCNWCIQQIAANRPLGCAENPRVGRETAARPVASGRDSDVVAVVGSGPGGIAAALLLDQAGYQVTLFEGGNDLAPGLLASAAAPKKDKYLWYRDYLIRRLGGSGVRVRLNHRVSVGDLADMQPVLTVLATGSSDRDLADIAGLDQPHVRSAYDVLTGRAALGPGPVFIYGAGEVGSETAKYASARGRQVTLATRSTDDRAIMRQALRIFRNQLVATVTEDPAITIRTGCTLTGIGPDHVQVMTVDGPADIPAATVLLAAGRVSETALISAVSAAGLPHTVIGDARDVRRIGDAVNDAYDAVRDWTRQQDPSAPPLGELPC